MTAGYDTLTDADAWGTDTLKGWVEDYESTRFTQINEHTAVIRFSFSCIAFSLD